MLEMFPGGVNEMTGIHCSRSGSFCCTTESKNRLSQASAWKTSETTAEDFILSDRRSNTLSFILRCRDGSGATLYDLSAASAILLSANPSPPKDHLHLLRCDLYRRQYRPLLLDFWIAGKQQYKGATIYRSSAILGILHTRNVAQG